MSLGLKISVMYSGWQSMVIGATASKRLGTHIHTYVDVRVNGTLCVTYEND
jgi:hypothetical protein